MDATIVTALAALGGSLVGGLTSFVTSLMSQRLSARRDREIAELDRREALYAEFARSASELMLDSIGSETTDVRRMVSLMTTVGHIRVISTEPVLIAAQAVVGSVMASYQAAPADLHQSLISRAEDLISPMTAFSDACRDERHLIKRRL